jgi:hypothetical protein
MLIQEADIVILEGVLLILALVFWLEHVLSLLLEWLFPRKAKAMLEDETSLNPAIVKESKSKFSFMISSNIIYPCNRCNFQLKGSRT